MCRFLTILEIDLPYCLLIPILCIYSKKFISYYRDSCSSIFTAAQVTIAKKIGNSIDAHQSEWIMKILYVFIGNF